MPIWARFFSLSLSSFFFPSFSFSFFFFSSFKERKEARRGGGRRRKSEGVDLWVCQREEVMTDWLTDWVAERLSICLSIYLLPSLRHLKNLRESPFLNFFVFACKNLIPPFIVCVFWGAALSVHWTRRWNLTCTKKKQEEEGRTTPQFFFCGRVFLFSFLLLCCASLILSPLHNGTHAKKASPPFLLCVLFFLFFFVCWTRKTSHLKTQTQMKKSRQSVRGGVRACILHKPTPACTAFFFQLWGGIRRREVPKNSCFVQTLKNNFKKKMLREREREMFVCCLICVRGGGKWKLNTHEQKKTELPFLVWCNNVCFFFSTPPRAHFLLEREWCFKKRTTVPLLLLLLLLERERERECRNNNNSKGRPKKKQT